MCAASGTHPRCCSWYPVQQAQVSHFLTASNWPPFCTSALPLLFGWNVMFCHCCFYSDPHTISGLSLALPFFTEGVRTLQEICTLLYFIFCPFTCFVSYVKVYILLFMYNTQMGEGIRCTMHNDPCYNVANTYLGLSSIQ